MWGCAAGGKKRNFYHDDMWTIKYLKGFKWRHLTEKLGACKCCDPPDCLLALVLLLPGDVLSGRGYVVGWHCGHPISAARMTDGASVGVCLFVVAYERRVREQKLRVEMMQAKRENTHFLQLVEQKKAIEGMEARKVRLTDRPASPASAIWLSKEGRGRGGHSLA